MVPGTESWGLKDWLEAGSYLVAILLFVAAPIVWLVKRRHAEPSRDATPAVSVPAHPEPGAYEYAHAGRHGLNILAADFESVRLKAPVSLRAVVPQRSELRVRIKGPKPEYLDQTSGAWFYTLPPVNWTANTYSESLGETFPVQTFTAEGGIADVQMTFERRGEYLIEAFEGSGRQPTWTKTFRVTL